MFRKQKLKVAVALFVSTATMSGGLFAAPAAYEDDQDDIGDDHLIFFPAAQSTVSDASPKIWFNYDPGATGYFIDLVKVATGTVTVPLSCGDGITSVYLAANDPSINCGGTVAPSGSDAGEATTNALCTWTVPSVLTDGVYAVNLSKVSLTTATTGTGSGSAVDSNFIGDIAARNAPNCMGDTTGAAADTIIRSYQTFSVDTSSVLIPNNTPEKVVITTPELDTAGDPQACNSSALSPIGAGVGPGSSDNVNDCMVTFTHKNTDGATWYKVWITDKNGIRVGDDTISNDGADTDYGYGWFKLHTTLAKEQARVACSVDLATDLRTCTLGIGNEDTAAIGAVPEAGNDYTIWVQGWNPKGLSEWSASRKFKYIP